MNIQTHMEDLMNKVTYISTSITPALIQDTALDPTDEFFEWYNKREEDRQNKQMDKVIAEYYS